VIWRARLWALVMGLVKARLPRELLFLLGVVLVDDVGDFRVALFRGAALVVLRVARFVAVFLVVFLAGALLVLFVAARLVVVFRVAFLAAFLVVFLVARFFGAVVWAQKRNSDWVAGGRGGEDFFLGENTKWGGRSKREEQCSH